MPPSSRPPSLPVLCPPLAFPPLPLHTRPDPNPTEIFDPVRKKFVTLTPEEWVRQHLILFLHLHRGYPLSLTAVERRLSVRGSSRRFDIALFHPSSLRSPALLVECKAPSVAISPFTFAQSGLYNLTLRVPFLLLSNGLTHHCFQTEPLSPLPDIPHFSSISSST